MNRKLILSLLIGFICCAPYTLPASNMQHVISVHDDVHEAITHLYIQQGLALPSSSGPWSADELMKKLERLDASSLSPKQQRTYDYVQSRLTGHLERKGDASVLVDFGLELATETYLKTNTEDPFALQEDIWLYDYTRRSPVLNIPLDVWAADHLYGYFEVPLMNSRHYEYFDQGTATNLIIDQLVLHDNATHAVHIPRRGYVSAGANHWNAQFGRDVLSWGDGISGDLILGDHLDYHEFIAFSTYHNRFKFTTLIASFAHPMSFYKDKNDYFNNHENLIGFKKPDPIEGFRAFIAHRLEFRPWDTLKISVSETMMYMGDSFDFRFLNPGMIYHNYYMRSNSKSMVALDIDYALRSGVNLYLNTVIDDHGLFSDARAIGLLGGIKTSFPAHKGIFFANLEFAYTDPLLYLRDPGGADFPIDYIVSIWQWGEYFPPDGSSGLREIRRFLGYRHGSDTVALQTEAGYKEYGVWSLKARAALLLQGTVDIYTCYEEAKEKLSGELAPSTSYGDHHDIQTTLAFELLGAYHPTDTVSLFCHLGLVHVWNPNNDNTQGNVFDVQVSTGISYAL